MCDQSTLKERYEREQIKDKCVPRWIRVPYDERHKLKTGVFVRRYVIPPVGNDKVSLYQFWMDSDIFLTESAGKTTEHYLYHDAVMTCRTGFVSLLFNGEVWICEDADC